MKIATSVRRQEETMVLRNAIKFLALLTALAASTSAMAQNCNSEPRNCRGLQRGPELNSCLLWNGKIQDACNRAGDKKKTEAVGNVDSADSDQPVPRRRR
jgi:hypothetical protein